uniref:Uncharacterized protein n=1 Tax=Arundo donax TaxID=35708 RepID=A0A0A9EPQ2_ARUDO
MFQAPFQFSYILESIMFQVPFATM